ncbi:hypothetical protein L7F22_006843 [Adiantum nelumboides]|nr:hypothetical protein [Adiantum nelumboides]
MLVHGGPHFCKNKTAPVKWLKFKKLFISSWLTQEYERDIRAAWNHLRMTKRDTVDAYCERFWSAFLPASSFKKISVREQIERFTLGLPIEIRGHCLEQKSASIQELMSHAKLMKTSLFVYLIFLQELSDEDRTNISTLDKERQDFLHSHIDCFSEGLPGELPPVRPEDHTIDLIPESTPPNRPPYRVSRTQNEEIMNQVKDLLDKGLIQPSSSPFCSLVLLVLKKDGSWRMCIDYRALNKITIKNRFSIPRIDDILDRLQGSLCFSRIDLKSGYHQIRIASGDVYKTAFRTTLGYLSSW